MSIMRSVAHRPDAIEAAGALTNTCISRLLPLCSDATITTELIKTAVYETLRHFDTAAAVSYGAFHQMPAKRL